VSLRARRSNPGPPRHPLSLVGRGRRRWMPRCVRHVQGWRSSTQDRSTQRARNALAGSNQRHFTLPHGSQRVFLHWPSRQSSHAPLVAMGWLAQHSQQSARVVMAQSVSEAQVVSPMLLGSLIAGGAALGASPALEGGAGVVPSAGSALGAGVEAVATERGSTAAGSCLGHAVSASAHDIQQARRGMTPSVPKRAWAVVHGARARRPLRRQNAEARSRRAPDVVTESERPHLGTRWIRSARGWPPSASEATKTWLSSTSKSPGWYLLFERSTTTLGVPPAVGIFEIVFWDVLAK